MEELGYLTGTVDWDFCLVFFGSLSHLVLKIFSRFAAKLVGIPKPQSNDWYKGPTQLVQHFAYSGSSHRRKSAVRHIIDMVCWLYCSPIPEGRKGVFYLLEWFLPAFAAPRRRGRSPHSQHPKRPRQKLVFFCKLGIKMPVLTSADGSWAKGVVVRELLLLCTMCWVYV